MSLDAKIVDWYTFNREILAQDGCLLCVSTVVGWPSEGFLHHPTCVRSGTSSVKSRRTGLNTKRREASDE